MCAERQMPVHSASEHPGGVAWRDGDTHDCVHERLEHPLHHQHRHIARAASACIASIGLVRVEDRVLELQGAEQAERRSRASSLL